MFNGPSPSWIKTVGLAWEPALGPRPPHTGPRRSRDPSHARRKGASRVPRAAPLLDRRAVAPPPISEAVRPATYTHRSRAGAPRAGAPPRGRYFLLLHAKAERAYEPQPYDGELLVFYGEGMYEDPHLGWGAHVTGRIDTWAVPGEHTNNRQVFIEPHVDFVRERLEEHLGHGARGR